MHRLGATRELFRVHDLTNDLGRQPAAVKRSSVSFNDGSSAETSLNMLAEAGGGLDTAWQRLVNRYGRRIYRWCRCSGLQPADASNVTEEVFQAVARALPNFERGTQIGSFRTWIRTIARNKIHDQFRQMSRQRDVPRGGDDSVNQLENVTGEPAGHRSELACDSRSEENSGYRNADLQWLAQMREIFSPRDWQFFWRLVVDGQNASEVASEFGVSANTVRLVKMRVLRRLREEFNAIPTDQSP